MSTRSALRLKQPCYICLVVAKLIGLVVPDIELIGLCQQSQSGHVGWVHHSDEHRVLMSSMPSVL